MNENNSQLNYVDPIPQPIDSKLSTRTDIFAPTVSQSVESQKVTKLTEQDVKNELLKMMRGRKSTTKNRGRCNGAFGKK